MSTYWSNFRSNRAQVAVSNLFAHGDILINGKRPWDIQVHDDRFFSRILSDGTLGFGESYMEGWWECEALDEMCFRAIRAHLNRHAHFNLRTAIAAAASFCINLQSKCRARLVSKVHYDLGNDFFETMLGPIMQYSCAYFSDNKGLPEAQRAKMDLICCKLGLQTDMRILDIGCGWGALAKHAAQYYGCNVVGITISKKQHQYAKESCRNLPIEIRLQDYRDISEPFDRIISVGMMEHVGHKNYRTYMEVADRCLRKDGLFLCQTICGNRANFAPDVWIERYIFPHSALPSVSQVVRAAEGLFILEDAHNFGVYYDLTLLAWENNFRKSWKYFQSAYGESFYRMWRFYLLSCAGAFRARDIQLLQFVFSKGGILGGYHSIR